MEEITKEVDSQANASLDESKKSPVKSVENKKKTTQPKRRQFKPFFKNYWREIIIGIFICYCFIQFDKLNGIERDLYYLERTVDEISSISSDVESIKDDVWSVKYDLDHTFKKAIDTIDSIKDAVMHEGFLSGNDTVYEKTEQIYNTVSDIKDSCKTY